MSKNLYAVTLKNVAAQRLDTYSVNAKDSASAAHEVMRGTVNMGYVFVNVIEVM